MKAYGYSNKVDMSEGPLPLSEISFIGHPQVLREMAKFIGLVANQVECNPDFDQMHLRDAWDKWTEDYPDIIIVKPE